MREVVSGAYGEVVYFLPVVRSRDRKGHNYLLQRLSVGKERKIE